MKELSLHILDLVQNSLTAQAQHILISLEESLEKDLLILHIADDGSGMEPDFLAAVTDPFVTTRKTRPVGMGIPLVKMAAEMADGQFEIQSRVGEGTSLTARFRLSHLDRIPVGDMAGTVTTLVQGAPEVALTYIRKTDTGSLEFRTQDLIQTLGDIPLNEPEVLNWMREYILAEENRLMAQQ